MVIVVGSGVRQQLVVLGVGKPNKGKVVARECLGCGEVLIRCLVLDVVEISGVIVPRQVVDNRRNAVTNRGKAPLVIGEERVSLDLLGAIQTQATQPGEDTKVRMLKTPVIAAYGEFGATKKQLVFARSYRPTAFSE